MFIQSVNETIKLLEAINSSDEYAYERAVLAYRHLKEFPVVVCEEKFDVPIFHSRTHFDNDFFQAVSDVFLPPTEVVKYFGRCNRPGQRMLYCSENRSTSYYEFIEDWINTKKIHEKFNVTIGRWVLKNTLSSIIVTTPDETARISEYDKCYGKILDNHLNGQSSELKEANSIFYRYLTSKFRKPAKDDIKTYVITAAYCNLAFIRTKDKAQAICYPSVPSELGGQAGINWAISPNFATFNYMELTHIVRDEFKSYKNENNKISFHSTKYSEAKEINVSKNVIIW